jgi:hypothetical protein
VGASAINRSLDERHRSACAIGIARIVRADVRNGLSASVELGRHVGFTPDFGRMVATQLNDASGQYQT